MPSPGQPQCTPAPAGTYTATSGAFETTACEVGKYQGLASSSVCVSTSSNFLSVLLVSNFFPLFFFKVDCEPGRANNAVGQLICPDCAPGSFANASQQLTCMPCEVSFVLSSLSWALLCSYLC
jgi:hypothetical protein